MGYPNPSSQNRKARTTAQKGKQEQPAQEPQADLVPQVDHFVEEGDLRRPEEGP